jgi:hypothetical protein
VSSSGGVNVLLKQQCCTAPVLVTAKSFHIQISFNFQAHWSRDMLSRNGAGLFTVSLGDICEPSAMRKSETEMLWWRPLASLASVAAAYWYEGLNLLQKFKNAFHSCGLPG